MIGPLTRGLQLHRVIWLALILNMTPNYTWAAAKSTGVKVDAALGSPNVTLLNPDDSFAYYSGISLRGEAILPLFQRGSFTGNLSLLGRYLDLTNSASTSIQRELANHIGPGLGIRLAFAKLFLGTTLHYMRARHVWVGTTNNYDEFDYTSTSTFFGLNLSPGNKVNISLSYETTQATITSSQTLLSRDVPYTDKIVWIHITYSTGSSLSDLFNALLK